MTNPNKWVRKAIYFTLNGMTVSGKNIYVFDVTAPSYKGDAYIIISTQTNSTDKNKCGFSWLSTCELQVVTRYTKNTGSRLLADDIVENVLQKLDSLQLDTQSDLKILDQDFDMPGDFTTNVDGEIINQIVIRYTFRIN